MLDLLFEWIRWQMVLKEMEIAWRAKNFKIKEEKIVIIIIKWIGIGIIKLKWIKQCLR